MLVRNLMYWSKSHIQQSLSWLWKQVKCGSDYFHNEINQQTEPVLSHQTMKKTLSLLSALMLALTINAQVFIDESFDETGLPSTEDVFSLRVPYPPKVVCNFL